MTRNDLSVVVGTLSLAVHWPTVKLFTEIVNSVSDLVEIAQETPEVAPKIPTHVIEFIEEHPEVNDDEPHVENQIGENTEKTIQIARAALPQSREPGTNISNLLSIIPTIQLELQGVEVVIPTFADATTQPQKTFFVLELRSALFSYSRTEAAVVKVKFLFWQWLIS